jgi:hypothetical protein
MFVDSSKNYNLRAQHFQNLLKGIEIFFVLKWVNMGIKCEN